MGIRGLYSFVDSYDDFFVDVKLCNEKIIIGMLMFILERMGFYPWDLYLH